MGISTEEAPFLKEFKQFFKFLQNLWSILASASVLFPLSNAFAKIVPLSRWPEGGLVFFSPALFSIISSLACIFTILYVFERRHQVGRRHHAIQKKAAISFLSGVTALIIYLTVYISVENDIWFTLLGVESGDLLRVISDIILLTAYSGFFVLVTLAFMLLGMVAYFGHKPRPE